ncbi:MAG TPA: hypothetical protein PK358_06525 [Spirochaetota bacterium]|nr:hypothetical protein [Spirochaetota bacterium]
MKKTFLITTSLLITGIFTGWLYGTSIINSMMKGEIGISTFVFLPSKNILDTYILLNSRNELNRLEGYYSYKESGLNDHEFLIKRYKIEKSVLIRKTIIWILESSGNDTEKLDIYKKLYEASPASLKKYLQKKINNYDLIKE